MLRGDARSGRHARKERVCAWRVEQSRYAFVFVALVPATKICCLALQQIAPRRKGIRHRKHTRNTNTIAISPVIFNLTRVVSEDAGKVQSICPSTAMATTHP